MAENNNTTIFQRLTSVFSGGSPTDTPSVSKRINSYGFNGSEPIFTTRDKAEYERKKLELRQQSLLAKQWRKANYDISNNSLVGLSETKIMYRDADLMDAFPEIGAALDVVSEEVCQTGKDGALVNVSSKSQRIKSILEDLLVNRLSITTTLPMVARSTCKYGNTFMLLNIDAANGILGWRQMPVYEMERYESMSDNPYSKQIMSRFPDLKDKENETQFIWVGKNDFIPYRNWQMAHFRLLYDSLFLPYGCSFLNKARRHFRMLSLMEDMMLLYRLERSVERRVFKIDVGSINEEDVPSYVQQIADNFKRTPFVDQATGQLDLRKNILPVWRETPIPLLDGRTITIEQLAKEFDNGCENYVYSVQDKTHQIVPGKVVWCGKNYTAKNMIKVTLDDGGYIVLAPEHEFIMNDYSKKRADKIEIGDTILPFDMSSGKVSKIEYVNGDDVYCMTVLGVNGEEDRHNFAVLSLGIDQNPNRHLNGVFVSNCQSDDYFFPTRDPSTPSPIETLPAAQNLTALDDIKYVQNKVFTALRVPKPFLNFEENAGDGKNLSLLDVRFTRTVNRIQQMMLMELNKICIIHLYLLGFTDELTNFSLTMNNPSTQAEMLELENTAKKISTIRDAVSDPGNGIPVMSMYTAWKTVLGWSEKEISENLDHLRLEVALANELEKTPEIIKNTGIFKYVDNIYGEPGAKYSDEQQQEGGEEGGTPGGGSGGGFDFGGGEDMGMPEEDMTGAEGEMGMEEGAPEEAELGGAPSPEQGTEEPQVGENLSQRAKKPLLTESGLHIVNEKTLYTKPSLYNKTFIINEELNTIAKNLDQIIGNDVHTEEEPKRKKRPMPKKSDKRTKQKKEA